MWGFMVARVEGPGLRMASPCFWDLQLAGTCNPFPAVDPGIKDQGLNLP